MSQRAMDGGVTITTIKYNFIPGIIMTTEKQSENTPAPAASNNKIVFGPLGKYAAIAVIMVSIIVTTAIMLGKQLNTVDEQIAAIEKEVAEIHAAKNDSSTDETTTTEAQLAQNATVTPVVTEADYNAEQANSAETAPLTAAQFKMATTKTSAQTRQTQLAKENQARIEASKLKQKQYMADIFARIKVLESQQLDRYKTNQDGQVVRLRKQITQQQQMIEALVLRNKDLFELRSANMKRNQTNREQALNRI